ncbi:MAG: hypothetical protein AB7O56_14660 [Bauldia sp.]
MKRRFPLALTAAIAVLAAPAAAQTSTYTSLALDACTERPVKVTEELPLALWDCPGHGDVTVLVSESDARFGIAYGIGAPAQLADSNTLSPFNSLGDTLEWRLDAEGQPIATIVRYFTQRAEGGDDNQVLVVSRLGDASCPIAYVNALANEDANAIAQQAADLFAATFVCDLHTPMWIGQGAPAF